MNRYWIMLLIAAGLEIFWAIGLKYTAGFTRLWPSVGTILAMAASMYLLARAAEGLPIGTAYAVWTGIGAVGTTIVGPAAGELIGIAALAMQHGLGPGVFGSAVFPYPTVSLALRQAGDAFRRQSLTPAVRRALDYYFRIVRGARL